MRRAAMRVHSTGLDDAENRGSDSLPRPQKQRLIAALMFITRTHTSPENQLRVYGIGSHSFRSSCTLRN